LARIEIWNAESSGGVGTGIDIESVHLANEATFLARFQ
jgi:hypothetical protein